MAKLKFDEIKDTYEQAKSSGNMLASGDLKSFAAKMQQYDTKNDWSEGQLPDNLVTSASRGVDTALEITHLPQLGAGLIGALGSGVDTLRGADDAKYEQLGSQIGKDLPRGIADTGMVLGGAALTATGAGAGVGVPLMALGAADAGAKAYTDTGSKGAGLVSGALTAAAPGIGKVGGSLGLKLLPKSLATSPVANFAAAEVGQELTFGAVGAGEQMLRGENPLSGENLFANLAGTAAFLPVTLHGGIKAFREAGVPKPKSLDPYQSDVELSPGLPPGEFDMMRVGKGPKIVDSNDASKLFNYLTGNKDEEMARLVNQGELGNALRMSGIEPPQDKSLFDETLQRREKGRELAQQAGDIGNTPERTAALQRKAEKLLQVAPNNLVDFVQIVQARNEFMKSLPNDGNAPKFGGYLEGPPENTSLINVGQPKGAADVFDAAREMEGSTWSKPKSLEEAPPVESSSKFERDPETIELPYEPGRDDPIRTGERPVPQKGKVVPNKLADRLRRPEFSIGMKDDGSFDAESLKKGFHELTQLGDNPDQATLRLGLIAQNALREQTQSPQTYAQRTAESTMSRTFDGLGLSETMKSAYVGATNRILGALGLDPNTAVYPIESSAIRAQANGQTLNDAIGVHLTGGGERPAIGVRSEFSSAPERANHRADVLTKTLAHEAMHGVFEQARLNAKGDIDQSRWDSYSQARTYSEGLTPEMRLAHLDELFKAANSDTKFMNLKYAASDAVEFMTEYGAQLAYVAYAKPKNLPMLQKVIQHLPTEMQNFIRGFARTVKELGQMVSSTLFGKGRKEADEFARFHQNMSELIRPDPVVETAKKRIMGATNPMRVLESDPGANSVQFSKVGVKAMDERQDEISKAGLIQRNVAQHQQLAASPKYAEQIPAYQKVVSILTNLPGAVQTLQHAMRGDRMLRVDGGYLRELASTKDKKLTPAEIRRKSNYAKVGESKPLQKAYSDLSREMNLAVSEAAKSGDEFPGWDSPRFAELWKGMSPEDAASVRMVLDSDLEGNRQAGATQVRARQEEILYDIAGIYKSAGHGHADSETMARALTNSVMQGRTVPSHLLAVPGTEKAARHWENIAQSYADFERGFDRPYFTELRTGRYYIPFEVPGAEGEVVTGSRSADSIQERNAIVKELQGQGYKVKAVEDRHSKEYNEFDVVPTYLLDRAAALEKARYDSFLNSLDNAAMAGELREGYSGGEAILEQIALRKGSANEREFKPGRESINMVNAQQAYVEIIANSAAKQMARNKVRWQLKHEDWMKDPRLQNEVQEFSTNVLAQGRQAFQTFRKAVIGTAMGVNPSSAFIDATQPLTMGLHRLVEHVGIGPALKAVGKGYLEAFKPTGKINPEFEQILIKADTKGLLTTGSRLEDFVSQDDLASYNIARAGGQRDLVDLEGALTSREFMAGKVFDWIKALGNKAFNAAMLPMSISAQVNNKTMLFAGYEVGKAKGLKGDALYDFAENMMQVTNIQGARAAQSSFKLKAGKWNEAVSTASLLTNYPIAVFSQMYGSYKSALKSSGLSPEARSRALQAFASQALTQFAFAGSLGFGLDALFELSKEWFGVDPENEIRQGLASIDESGILGDVIMHGAMNQITGVDVASRFSLSGIGGLNGYTGFDAKGLFGAAGSFWSNLAQLPGAITEDRSVDQWGVLPGGFRKMVQAVSGEPMKDKNGQVLMEPSETDRILTFLGFRPKELADVQEQRSAMRSADELVKRQGATLSRQRVEMLQKGEFQEALNSVRAQMAEQAKELKEAGVPDKTIEQEMEKRTRSTILSLVQQTVEKSNPIDPMSEGSLASAGARGNVAQSFGAGQRPPQQMAVMKQQAAALLQGLGQKLVHRTPKSIQMTQAVDALVMQHPDLARQEAEMIVRSQMGQ